MRASKKLKKREKELIRGKSIRSFQFFVFILDRYATLDYQFTGMFIARIQIMLILVNVIVGHSKSGMSLRTSKISAN